MTLRHRFSKLISSQGTPSPPKKAQQDYQELRLGVWRVLLAKKTRYGFQGLQWETISANLPLMRRALSDVYVVSPSLFVFTILAHLWYGVEDSLSLYFSNRLLFFIEKRIVEGTGDSQSATDLYWATISRIACSALSGLVRWASQGHKETYSALVKQQFEGRLFTAKLTRDLPTSQRNSSISHADSESVYDCLEQAVELAKSVVSFLLHLRLITHIVGSGLHDGGPIFLAVCILPLTARSLLKDSLWSKAYVAQAVNTFYIRKSALAKVVENDLKPEVMAGGAGGYLLNEYKKAQEGLEGTPDTRPELLFGIQRQAISSIFLKLCSDGPMLYFAFLALVSPSKLSVVKLAVLEQTSISLRYTFSSLVWAADTWPTVISRMQTLYTALDIENEMKDGATPYPRPGLADNVGMSLELRNVSFSYPNTKSERAALTNVSFTVKPGQLVVIVGANGSGKSTIIKLLSRYYDMTSGSILVDGLPIEEYRTEELRKGIAMLTQEHQLFPLSVEENLGLGSSEEAMGDKEKLWESTRLAGAEGIVKNFSKGLDTVLEPVSTGYLSYSGQGNKELEGIFKDMERSASVSGGERQRLVAARTFMRLLTSPVKLVTVDEPSSALDPEGEYQLFAKLREARKGRTMIFVTHRFAHLTKYADLIVCIKEGAVVETGTHVELLARGGEYAHLYSVQAQAFATA
ncbi:hypothetical protein PAXINDRAFT_10381 [Paxillus involutus ATCC 200175]|nr:hypothetical protein PAXINDRAFT_10381 [Paxillus involutus ATCC 200175]